MKQLCAVLLATMLTACGTVRGTASGFVGGVGIDVNTVGDSLGSLADKIKPEGRK
jgi:predicted small secreted protein